MESKINIVPYGEYLAIEPVTREQVLVSDSGNLQTFGKVTAIGKDVTDTNIGDYVAFELWDLRSFDIEESKYYFVKESEIICKINDASLGRG